MARASKTPAPPSRTSGKSATKKKTSPAVKVGKKTDKPKSRASVVVKRATAAVKKATSRKAPVARSAAKAAPVAKKKAAPSKPAKAASKAIAKAIAKAPAKAPAKASAKAKLAPAKKPAPATKPAKVVKAVKVVSEPAKTSKAAKAEKVAEVALEAKPVAKAPVKQAPVKAPPPPPPPKKPRKPELTPREIAGIKVWLVDQRADFLRQVAELDEGAFNISQSEMSGEVSFDEESADAGSFTFEREKELSIGNNIRDLVDKATHALATIERGTYGLCERCGDPIPKARLMALPYSTMCLRCKQQDERTR